MKLSANFQLSELVKSQTAEQNNLMVTGVFSDCIQSEGDKA
jgi:hypothetical protein